MSAKKKIVFALAVVLASCAILAVTPNASAQEHYSGDYLGNRHHAGIRYHFGTGHHYGWNHGLGYRSYGYYRHYGHEFANVIRSQAQANLLNAQARTQNEIARSARLDNNVKELDTYLERRRINSTARFAHLWERGAQVRALKASAAEAAQLAGLPERANERLAADELNPQTGRLTWPLLLQMERFTLARRPVNEVFKRRAISGKINPDHYLPLIDWLGKVEQELDKNVHNYPAEDFADANDFLDRLATEARLSIPSATSVRLVSK